MKRRIVIIVLLIIGASAWAQEDQRPRPPMKNDRGLLQINREYFDLAANTGGDFYFWAPGEFSTARLNVPIHHVAVLLSYGALESERSFEIPIESNVKEMTLFSGIQRMDLAVLIRPDGTVAKDRDPGVTIQLFQHMFIATVTSPKTGVWRLELHGAGTYAVTAHVKPGDDGPRSIDFDPLTCKVSQPDVKVMFVRKDATLISEYAGDCATPQTPFRVIIRGLDANGARFQRIESAVHIPKQ
jgi:hypothetical protein